MSVDYIDSLIEQAEDLLAQDKPIDLLLWSDLLAAGVDPAEVIENFNDQTHNIHS